jgi:hypothetical protein
LHGGLKGGWKWGRNPEACSSIIIASSCWEPNASPRRQKRLPRGRPRAKAGWCAHAIKLTCMRGIRAQRMIPSVFPRRADDSRESTSPASQAGHVLERYRAYRRASG